MAARQTSAAAPEPEEATVPPISYPSIHELMGRILNDLPAIGKHGQAPASMGGYAFRGIEDVLNALNPILAGYGVFYVPTCIERIESLRQTNNGKPLYVVNLLVNYTFYGPAGDSIDCAVWGEGSDSGDKATQKAMTAAQKYMLFQVFCISTEEQQSRDAERNEVPETVLSPQQQRKEAFVASGMKVPAGLVDFEEMDTAHEGFKTGLATLADEQREAVKAHRLEKGYPWPMPLDDFNALLDFVTALRDEHGFGAEEGA